MAASEIGRRGRQSLRFSPPTAEDIRIIRQNLGLTQEEFAERFGFDAVNVRRWEQKRGCPDQVSCLMFKLIDHDPESASGLVRKMKKLSPA
jgi:putative transcriptional regulator